MSQEEDITIMGIHFFLTFLVCNICNPSAANNHQDESFNTKSRTSDVENATSFALPRDFSVVSV